MTRKWTLIHPLATKEGGLQSTILTQEGDTWSIEVRRESRNILGPLPVGDGAAWRCLNQYGFKEVLEGAAPGRRRRKNRVA